MDQLFQGVIKYTVSPLSFSAFRVLGSADVSLSSFPLPVTLGHGSLPGGDNATRFLILLKQERESV